VRQEVAHVARFGTVDLECTSFAVSGPYTRTGGTFAGQNADLSGGIEQLAAVLTFAVTGKPAVMMLVPAGQISYLGISSEGLSADANFLRSAGWRTGFPRYLLTRLAIEQPTLKAAVDAALTPRRASSRNLLLADRAGAMVDIETTAEEHALTWGDGCLAHADHHVLPGIACHETATPDELHNSTCRHERIAALVEAGRGHLDADALQGHPARSRQPAAFHLRAPGRARRLQLRLAHLRSRRGPDGDRGGPALRARVRDLHGGGPAIATELWRLDAGELAEMIRRRDVSCREVVTAALARLDAVNPRINAVVRPLHETALAEAAAADQALARGAAVGPLHGVPITTKVNVDQTVCPTDNGVVAFKDLVATRDNPVVANLRRAGAIVIGRTNAPAFSMR
jgi:hypothetical protein